MKLNFNDEYFKVIKSEIPTTYPDFLQTLPEILSPEPLPPKYKLRYFDLERYPIKVCNDRSYKAMLQEMTKLQEELILFITSEEQDESFRNMSNIISSMRESPYTPPFQRRPYPSQQARRGPVMPEIKLEEGIAESLLTQHDSPITTIYSHNKDSSQGILINESNGNNIHEISSSVGRTYSVENVEFVINEQDVIRKGLSERIDVIIEERKEPKEKENNHPEKTNKSKKSSTLKKELRALEKDNNQATSRFWEGYTRDERQVISRGDSGEVIEIIEKKIQTLPVRRMCVSNDQSKLLQLVENVKVFQEKWKNDYLVEADFISGSLKVIAVQEQLTKSRFKPNTTITDEKIENMMKELIEALKFQGYSSQNIDSLTFNFKNCSNLSKVGVSHLFQTINQEFKNVRTLDLDFSFNRSSFHSLKMNPNTSDINLELHHLESLILNFDNRCDVMEEDIIAIVESLEKNSKETLKSFNLSLPMYYAKPEAKKIVKTKLNFIQDLKISP